MRIVSPLRANTIAEAVSNLKTATAVLKAKPIHESILKTLRKIICIIVSTLNLIKETTSS